jgi:hypothetical protein
MPMGVTHELLIDIAAIGIHHHNFMRSNQDLNGNVLHFAFPSVH